MITGIWGTKRQGRAAVQVRDWELKSSPLSLALGRPIRDQVFTTRDDHATTFQALELVNGSTLESRLRRGSLRMLGQLPPAPVNLFDSGVMSHGVVTFDVDISGAQKLWLLTQDTGSYDPARTLAGWSDVELSGPGGTKKLSELVTLSKFDQQELTADEKMAGRSIIVPLNNRLVFPIGDLGLTRIRGRVAVDDRSRASDIGGAVRFFIFTAEPDPERLVKLEGQPPVPSPAAYQSVDEAVQQLYLTLFSRKPSGAEAEVARQFFTGSEAQAALRPAALEDFLWSLLLHPDFQYVY
jgi:hypothetical protein